jgi:hypothetical protein
MVAAAAAAAAAALLLYYYEDDDCGNKVSHTLPSSRLLFSRTSYSAAAMAAAASD